MKRANAGLAFSWFDSGGIGDRAGLRSVRGPALGPQGLLSGLQRNGANDGQLRFHVLEAHGPNLDA